MVAVPRTTPAHDTQPVQQALLARCRFFKLHHSLPAVKVTVPTMIVLLFVNSTINVTVPNYIHCSVQPYAGVSVFQADPAID